MRTIIFILIGILTLSIKLQAQTLDIAVDMQAQLNVRTDIEQAMWVWNTLNIVYDVDNEKEKFFLFCHNHPGFRDIATSSFSQRPINRLFFDANGFLLGGSEEWRSLRSFLREAHEQGIMVDYLDGDVAWITQGNKEPIRIMDSLVKFNATGDSIERFDGFQFDVEPYLLPGWGTDALWEQYFGFMSEIHNFVENHPVKIRFGCTIPRWYYATIGGEHLKQIYRLVDYTAIMDYVNDEPRLILDPTEEIALADSMKVRVYIGIETGKNFLPTLSFHDKGWLALQHAVNTLNSHFLFYKNYAGVSIHYNSAYEALMRTNRSIDVVAQWTETHKLDSTAFLPVDMNLVIVHDPMTDMKILARTVRRAQTNGGDYEQRIVLSTVELVDKGPVYNLFYALDTLHRHIALGDEHFYKYPGMNTTDLLEYLSDETQTRISVDAQAGFDGFVVDMKSVMAIERTLSVPNAENTVVDLLEQAKAQYVLHSPLFSAMLVVRVEDGFLQRLDKLHYQEFMTLVNGVILDVDNVDIAQYIKYGVKVLSTGHTDAAHDRIVLLDYIASFRPL